MPTFKTTPLQFAELLIPPVMERYKKNIKDNLRRTVFNDKEYTSDERGFVCGVFYIENSDEKREYWNSVARNIEKYLRKGG
jgi:hypothetical protein